MSFIKTPSIIKTPGVSLVNLLVGLGISITPITPITPASAEVTGPGALVRQELGTYTFTGSSGAPSTGPIMDNLVGPLEMAPVAVDMSSPVAASRIGNNVHVVGSASGYPAEQIIDLSNGATSGTQVFQELSANHQWSSALFEVRETPFGVIRIGEANDGVGDTDATYWTAWNNPISAVFDPNDSSVLLDIANDGTFVGYNINGPAIGAPGTYLQNLVTSPIDAVATWISKDARFIVTDGAIVQMVNGNPVEISFVGWDPTPGEFGYVPFNWKAIETDPVTGRARAVGIWSDVDSFTERVAVYDAEPGTPEYGTLLFVTAINTPEVADLEIIDGQLLLAVNQPGFDGILYAMDGSSKTVTEITGTPGLFIRHGLFSGSLGLALQHPTTGDAYATSYHTNSLGGPSAVAVAVDWNNDGTTDETFALASGVANASHKFPSAAAQTITAKYLDSGNQVITTDTFPVNVTAYRLDGTTGEYVVGALNTGGTLKLTSTTTGWKFFLNGVLQNVQVAPGARLYGSDVVDTFTVSARTGETIQVYAGDGNDSITKTGAGTSYVFGGNGDDWISVAGGQNLLNGEAGIDYTLGKGARNVQIGGSEADTVEARATKTLLISATGNITIADANGIFTELAKTTPSVPVLQGLIAGKVTEDSAVDNVSVYNKGWLKIGAEDTTYYLYPTRIKFL